MSEQVDGYPVTTDTALDKALLKQDDEEPRL